MHEALVRAGSQNIGMAKSGEEKMGGSKKAPGNGYLIMQHILGNAEHEEILLRVDFSSYRSKAWGCQLFGGIPWLMLPKESVPFPEGREEGCTQALWTSVSATPGHAGRFSPP